MSRSFEIRDKINAIFPWREVHPRGEYARDGYAIVVPNGAGSWKVWGDSLYPEIDGANSTAARCISGTCDIVPAREVVYMGGPKGKYWRRRTIILKGEGSAQ